MTTRDDDVPRDPRRASATPRPSLALLAALVAARLVTPLAALHPVWEFHRDELLYFAMGDHFAPFAMQFPPFIAAVAMTSTAFFGDAVWAARVPAALGGAATLAVALWLLRRLGGGAWAALLVTLGTIAAPVFLRPSVLFQPVVFDQLWALLAVASVLVAVESREPRWWLLTGLAFGVGALTKFSAAFYVVALAPAVLLDRESRGQLDTRWPWLGAALALLLALPSVRGQVLHDWPFLAQMRVLREAQLDRVSNTAFLAEQPLMLGTGALLAVVGLLAAIRPPAAVRATRIAAGWSVTLVLLMLVLDGKSYYAAPAYLPLFVTGALALATWTARAGVAGRRAVRTGAPVVLTAGAAFLLPLGVPCLAPDAMARYAARLGLTAAVATNRGELLSLPQDYADMLGWRAAAASVADAWRALPAAERARTVIAAGNYGQAGALAMYRARHGYPYPVSTASDFHAWGPGDPTATQVLVLDGPHARDDVEALFAEVTEVGGRREPRAVPEERDLRVFLARGPREPLPQVWATLGPRW